MNQYTYKIWKNNQVFITFASSIEEADVILFEKTGVKPQQTSVEIKFNLNNYGKPQK